MQLWKTPVLECEWAKLLEPAPQFDTSKPDAWSVDLLIPDSSPELEELQELFASIYEDLHGNKRQSPHWSPIKAHKDRTDVKVLRLKLEARTWQSKRPGGGTRSTEPPRLMDSRQGPWPTDELIGNGSRIKVAFSVYGWESNGSFGISAQPRIVMVVDHVPYEGGLDNFDMGIEEGGVVKGRGFDTAPAQGAPELDEEEIPY